MPRTPFDAVTRHAVFVERLKAKAVRDVLALLNGLGGDLFTQVAASDLEDLTRREVQSLLARLNRTIKKGYVPVDSEIASILKQFSAHEGDWQGDMLVRTGLVVDLGVASDADIWAAVNAEPFQGRFLKDWIAGLEVSTARRIKEAVTQGYADGRSALEVARDIRGTRSRKGIFDMSRRGAEMVVRTAFTHTASVARSKTYKANPTIKQEQWLSVLDGRTTFICFPAETMVAPAGEVKSAFKREYVGEMLVVTTAAGNEIRCTPNHPILTPRGWLGAAKLSVGNQVINADTAHVASICSKDNVSVESSIGAIYDAFSHPSVSTVTVESSSPTQFHGDGMVGQHKVNIASANAVLGDWIESLADEDVKETLLHGSHSFRAMPGSAHLLDHLVGRLPAIKAAKIAPVPIESFMEPTIATAHSPSDIRRPHSTAVEPNGLLTSGNHVATSPSGGFGPDSGIVQEVGNRGSAGPVVPADAADAFPFPISLDNIISIRAEFVSCHVYNLHTHLGYYIAGGIVVKNCQARDGNFYDVGEGPRPPAHPNCRSTMVPVTSRNKARLDKRETYQDWLTAQPAAMQDDILGKAKGQLFREGGLTVDRFVNRAGQEMTLDQLKAADRAAWDETFGE